MAEPEVVRVARQFRTALLAQERAQVLVMGQRWAMVERTLEAHIEALIAELIAQGAPSTVEQVYRMARYESLLTQVREQLRLYEGWADSEIRQAQRAAGWMGRESALATLLAAGARGVFDRLPARAVEIMAGLAGDGAPLFSLLRQRALWPTAAEGLAETLVEGLALGIGPRQVASRMKDGLAGGLNKALTIARTETLRAYRMGATECYRQSGVVQGFRRLASRDKRTCLACLMSDGERFALASELTDHPNGRCTAVPILIEGPPIEWQTGREYFEGLSPEAQRERMGPALYEAWQRDRFDLSALRRTAHSDIWGDSPRTATLAELTQ